MAMNVSNKTAIVTGAGSGINLAFAKILLSKNCNVIFADIGLRPEAKLLVEQHSKGNEGANAVFVETDVRDWKQLGRMFEVAEKEFGHADIVVPGAGIFEPPFSNFWQPPGTPNSASKDTIESSRYATIDINITHPIRTTQLAIAHFIKHNKNGVVHHISSVAGQVTSLAHPMYIASKHAIHGFVRSLAMLETPYAAIIPANPQEAKTPEEGRKIPKIRVNAVAPGLIKTPLWTDNPEKMVAVSSMTDSNWVTPEEVAEVMLRCIEEEEIVGGSIIEVAGQGTRKVTAFMDPGPARPAHNTGDYDNWTQDVWHKLDSEGWGQ